MKRFFSAVLLICFSLAGFAALPLVKNGRSSSVIVIADNAVISAKYAANELACYIEKATGAKLPVIKESDAKSVKNAIYIGNTAAARQAGLTQDKFPGEAFTIQEKGNALYIVGGEDNKKLFYTPSDVVDLKSSLTAVYSSGIVRLTRRGTVYGVYRFVSDFLNVRWLWPGELGTYIPGQKDLVIDSNFKLDGAPAFKNRHYRTNAVWVPYFNLGKYHAWGRKKSPNSKFGFSPAARQKYSAELQKYLLICQEGDSRELPAAASHIKWWNKHKHKNLDFFAMNDDGSRGFAISSTQTRGPRLCVSNPKLHEYIVANWKGGEYIGLGEADYRGFCRCPKCKEWDKPQPPELKGYSTTNRYIKYAKAIRELIRKRKGVDVKVSILMYMDYLYPPYPAEKLPWLYGKFVPWGSGFPSYFPITDAEFALLKRAWQGWYDAGVEMSYRPNYLLNGYAMPTVDIKQSLEFIRFAAERKMVGFDYDSLRGNWATKGPMLYGHMRLGVRPDLTVEAVLDEYYSAFGPAAGDVKKYWEFIAEHTKTVPGGGINHGNVAGTAAAYPDRVFAEAAKFLDAAAAKVKNSRKDYRERVAFIRIALDHARLCARFGGLYLNNQFTEARKVMDQILAFRRAHEHTAFISLDAAAGMERRSYKGLDNFIKGEFQYSSNPGIAKKNFNRKEWLVFSGLRASKWGFSYGKDKSSGTIVREYSAGKNNHFLTAKLDIRAYTRKTSNVISISFDNKEFTEVKRNAGQTVIDLTKFVKGKDKFYLKAEFTRKPGTSGPTDVLHRFRVDYTKANPETVEPRKKLEIGTGWIDFKPQWYFRKDVKNKGLSKAECNPKTFPAAKWSKVDVPARLEETAVGPYLGYGWYTAVFDVRNDWQGRNIDVLVGAVDKQAWVYFNGKYIGEHTVKSEKVGVGVLYKEPFIVQVPAKLINAGGKNLLQIKIHSDKGSSGIWKPVTIRPVESSELY